MHRQSKERCNTNHQVIEMSSSYKHYTNTYTEYIHMNFCALVTIYKKNCTFYISTACEPFATTIQFITVNNWKVFARSKSEPRSEL